MFGVENFWAFIMVSIGLAVSPGPDIVYVLTRGVAEGKRSALAAAAGFSLGNIVHLTLVTLGLSALIKASPVVMSGIKIAGACYLAYIAWQLWNSPPLSMSDSPLEKEAGISGFKVFQQSVIANLLNPKVILFFLSLFPQFINQEVEKAWLGILILGVIFILITWIIFSLVALFAGELNQYLRKRPAVGQWIPRGAAGILLLIAIVILLN